MKKEKKSGGKKYFRFRRLQTVLIVFVLLTVALCFAQGNVIYSRHERLLEPDSRETALVDVKLQEPECLILWEEEANSELALETIEAVLSQMKVGYDAVKGDEAADVQLDDYETIVISITNLSILDEKILEILDWARAGGGLMFMYMSEPDGIMRSIGSRLGIDQVGGTYTTVDTLHFVQDFMIGGQEKDYKITDPYESSQVVYLADGCEVYVESGGEYAIPLIWDYEIGEGKVVVNNLGFFGKGYRGFYSSSYTLLQKMSVYPVINASTFFIDDFPSPVPSGDSQYIERDYDMNVSDFYTNVWWNDIYNLAEEYGIGYTGLVIEEYSDQVEGPFARNQDVRRFRYFGNMLLDQGGEIGLHGYNHMPLCLEGFDYKGEYDSYQTWENYEDMAASVKELEGFCEYVFPDEEFYVYVPPSNILSDEGRRLISEETDVKSIASVYLPDYDGIAYEQEFEVAEDGIVETPRIISGYVMDEYTELVALSELNFHFVNTHFQQPDDTLDADRGAELGWEKMFDNLSEYVDWLYTSAPEIRNLTGTELAAAVQIYDNLEIEREYTEDELVLNLGNFRDEAWLMVRINEGTPGEVSGGKLEKLQNGLYLLRADTDQISIEIKKGES